MNFEDYKLVNGARVLAGTQICYGLSRSPILCDRYGVKCVKKKKKKEKKIKKKTKKKEKKKKQKKKEKKKKKKKKKVCFNNRNYFTPLQL